jgi:Tol biopolymer transport system component
MGTGPETDPSVSRDGARLVYSTAFSRAEVVVRDTRSGEESRLSGFRNSYMPAMAPDGSSVVFTSSRQGKFDLWLQPLDGHRPAGDPRKLTDHPGSAPAASFSPDGRFVAYFRVNEGKRDIWIVPVAGGTPERFTDDPASDVEPAFSPDGSRLAFISNRDGRDHVWVAPVANGRPAGPAKRLTHDETADRQPVWSPDGTRIAFVGGEDRRADVWTVPPDGSAPPARLTHGADVYLALWESSGKSLLLSGIFGGSGVELRRVSVADGKTVRVPALDVFGPASQSGGFSFSADCRIFAYLADETRGNIWLLEASPGSF